MSASDSLKPESASTEGPVSPTKAEAPSSSDSEDAQDAATLLALGTRALALKQYPAACEHLSRCVQAVSEQHGEMAPEVVHPLMLYGRALLANAVANSAVLGGKAGEDKVAQSKAPEASTSNAAATPVTAQNINFHFGDSPPDDNGEDAESDDEDGEEGGEDPEDDLENAFLMFDTARAILEHKKGERDADVQRAEVHRLLGDVATESEQFGNAQTEYQTTLDLLTPLLPPTDRALSEIHMLLALALDFVPGKAKEAVEHAEAAKDVLKKRGELEETSAVEKKDIEELLVEIDNKIEDLKLALTLPEQPSTAAASQAFDALLRPADPNAPVNNLNSLVKKKKRPAPPAEANGQNVEEEGKGKKAKVDPEEK